MRALALLPLALTLTSCLAAHERDPTRYPWDPRNVQQPPVVARGAIPPLAAPRRQFVPPPGTYCVAAIEPQATSGIVIGGKAPGIMACSTTIAPSSAWKRPR
jgi:hypothetical protein